MAFFSKFILIQPAPNTQNVFYSKFREHFSLKNVLHVSYALYKPPLCETNLFLSLFKSPTTKKYEITNTNRQGLISLGPRSVGIVQTEGALKLTQQQHTPHLSLFYHLLSPTIPFRYNSADNRTPIRLCWPNRASKPTVCCSAGSNNAILWHYTAIFQLKTDKSSRYWENDILLLCKLPWQHSNQSEI